MLGEQYLEVHRVAHGLGIRTNTTMLYGHIETFEHRVDHLPQLRNLQDETSGFQCFIPLAFHNENNGLERLARTDRDRRSSTLAVSRLLLDNIAHIKAYWVPMGLDVAQMALRFGADDLDAAPIVHETIYHSAGSDVPMGMTRADLIRLIRRGGQGARGARHPLWIVEELPAAEAPEAASSSRSATSGV